MTTVTKAYKELFVDLLTAKLYKERIEKAKEEVRKLGDSYYRCFISAALEKKMRGMGSRFFRHKQEIRLIFDGRSYEMDLSAPKPIPENCFSSRYGSLNHFKIEKSFVIGFWPAGSGFHTQDEIEKAIAWAEKHRAKFERLDKLEGESNEFRANLSNSIARLKSVKAIRALDASIAKEWDELMGDQGKEKRLPMIIPTDVINTIKAAQQEAAA